MKNLLTMLFILFSARVSAQFKSKDAQTLYFKKVGSPWIASPEKINVKYELDSVEVHSLDTIRWTQYKDGRLVRSVIKNSQYGRK